MQKQVAPHPTAPRAPPLMGVVYHVVVLAVLALAVGEGLSRRVG